MNRTRFCVFVVPVVVAICWMVPLVFAQDQAQPTTTPVEPVVLRIMLHPSCSGSWLSRNRSWKDSCCAISNASQRMLNR